MSTSKRKLLARCPRTGRWLSTGVEVSETDFHLFRSIASQVFCPHCVALHDWTLREAVLGAESSWRPEPEMA